RTPWTSEPTKPKSLDAQAPAVFELRPVHSLRVVASTGTTAFMAPLSSPEKFRSSSQTATGLGLGEGVLVGAGGGVSTLGARTPEQPTVSNARTAMPAKRMRGRGM